MLLEKKKMIIEKKYSIKHFHQGQNLKNQTAMCHAELVSASAFCFLCESFKSGQQNLNEKD